MRTTKKERHAIVLERARELARSGKYSDWQTVEAVLRFKEEYPEAREWLDNDYIRTELNRLCEEARKK